MHDESGRLVQHKQCIVLEKNVERDVLGLRLGGFGLGPLDADHIASARRVRGFDFRGIDGDVPFLDEPLDRTARHGGILAPQPSVEPLVGIGAVEGDGFGAHGAKGRAK